MAKGDDLQERLIRKLKLCSKELNESQVWLRIIIGAQLTSKTDVSGILAECVELSKIINASISTVKRRLNKK